MMSPVMNARVHVLTTQMMLLTNIFLYFKEYSDTEQSLACFSLKLWSLHCYFCHCTIGDYNSKVGLLQFS
jgi:hypothetical protein